MTSVFEQAIARRTAAGLGLRVHGIADRPAEAGPFVCYAKDADQRAAWVTQYEAAGCRVEAV